MKAEKNSEASPDAIIIGSGLGGLCAGYELAKKGVKVLLLERHNLPGGFSTSFVRGRFEFEPSLHELSATAAYEYLRKEAFGISFRKVPEAYRLILTEKNVDFTAPFGMENFIEAVADAVPGSEASVRNFMRICEESYNAFTYLGTNSPPNPAVLFKQYGNFLRTGAAVTDEVADAVQLPRDARDLIYPYWCYLGTSTDKVSFSLWASMVYSYLNFGAHIPDRKSHSLSVAFVREIRKAGGEIRCNAEVNKLLTHGRSVTGVELSTGETIRCSHIVSNISPHHVYGNLIDPSDVPAKASRMVNARTPGISFFVVYLGLDADREALGLTDYSYFIAPHMDTFRLAEGFADRYNPDPMQATVCLNTADESASPAGTCILSITAATTPEAWKDVDPWDYPRAKEEFAELLISQFEKATGTEIRSHIEEIESASPATFSRYTAAWNGSVYGYEAVPWDGIIPRVLADKKENYFKGLHFCGGNASRTYGFGSSMLSGKTAAEKTFEELK